VARARNSSTKSAGKRLDAQLVANLGLRLSVDEVLDAFLAAPQDDERAGVALDLLPEFLTPVCW
jgi:hypothetical protein